MEDIKKVADHALLPNLPTQRCFLLFQLQAEDIKKVADYVSQLRRVGKGHGEAGRCGGLLGCMQMLLPTAVRRECVS